MTQLALPLDRYWIVQGPDDGIREGGARYMGRLLKAATADEARRIEEDDGGTVARVVPAPDPLDDEGWRSL